jgi:hypothetical protein
MDGGRLARPGKGPAPAAATAPRTHDSSEYPARASEHPARAQFDAGTIRLARTLISILSRLGPSAGAGGGRGHGAGLPGQQP